MRAVLGFTAAAALVVAGAWWLAGLPGSLTATVQDTTIQASMPMALFGLGVLFVAFYVVMRLLSHLFNLPRYLRQRARARQSAQGQEAITRTLVALAAGDGEAARREAERGRRLIGDTPLMLTLSAQASRQAGHEGEAEAAYRALAARPEAPLLGFRGLMRQAMARGDWEAASDLARKAERVYPNAPWLREERTHLALRTNDWAEALRHSRPSARAALAVAAAETTTDPAESRRLAKQAFEAEPTLAPAAIAYANRLRASGKEKAAQDVLRRAWTMAPQPDLADTYLAPLTDPGARLQAAEEMVQGAPDHAEDHLLLARLALEAGRPAEAKHHAEAARAAGLNQRRLWLLIADIAEAEGDAAAGQDALRYAAVADPDPAWQCEACNTQPPGWTPVCPHCGTPGQVRWRQPKGDALPAPGTAETAPAGPGERPIPRLAQAEDVEGVPVP